MGKKTKALRAQLEAAEKRAREAEFYRNLSDDAHGAVRRLLEEHDVPMAAFIDDHVGNALIQRDHARLQVEKLRALLEQAISYQSPLGEAFKQKAQDALKDTAPKPRVPSRTD
jgi:hypothetical protein